jgi:hypothetical protein
MNGGPALDELPSGLASAPVNVTDTRTGLTHPMRFVGGLFGVIQHRDTLALEPEFGWAVVEDPA